MRAIRDAGYLVLQYWFFYAMNDWRSTFSGVNDHEADWEQITLFLTEPDAGGDPELAWVAFSSHDEVGDDLRRRVDDPDLQLIDGTHPVVHAGAGSHSGAYLPQGLHRHGVSSGGGEAHAAVAPVRSYDHALDEDPGALGDRSAIPRLPPRRRSSGGTRRWQQAWTCIVIDDDTAGCGTIEACGATTLAIH